MSITVSRENVGARLVIAIEQSVERYEQLCTIKEVLEVCELPKAQYIIGKINNELKKIKKKKEALEKGFNESVYTFSYGGYGK